MQGGEDLLREAAYTRFLEIMAERGIGEGILKGSSLGFSDTSQFCDEVRDVYKQIEQEAGVRVNGSLLGLYGERCLWGDVRQSIGDKLNPSFQVLEKALDEALEKFHEETMEVLYG